MQRKKMASVIAGSVAILLSLGAFYLAKRNFTSAATGFAAQAQAPAGAPGEVDAEKVPERVTNFLGNLTPGGTAEAAGRERNYVVTYQVAFLRKLPNEKAPEETLSYEKLRDRDLEKMPPYIYYGEVVVGKYDPAQPQAIAVRARIDGKEASGYVDARKLWLEPPLDRAASERYMAVAETAAVHVVPSAGSPAVLTLLQGEVVDAVGQLNFQGQNWVKARFNVPERPRYGFIAANEMKPLAFAAVNQSAVALEEVPKRIRRSELKFAGADRSQLARDGFYIEPLPPLPIDQLSVDDMADAYGNISTGEQAFITSDLFLHSYHLIFDRMLQDIEEKKFAPAATQLSLALVRTTEAELKSAPAAPPEYHEALLSDLLYFSVAEKVFDPAFVLPAAVRPQAETLVARINAGEGELPSTQNFLGIGKQDFTQYKIRGHYAKNEALRRYFRGMMWYGRRNFLLSDKTQTLAAILLPHLVETAHVARAFDALDGTVTYLIGRQDKYTLAGYRTVNQKIFGAPAPAFNELSANLDANLAAFQKAAWTDLPAPRIVSEQTGPGMTQEERLRATAGLKFLGQRFVLDAFILNQLTSPSVGTDQNPRNLPSALDVMMLLGSRAAREQQQEAQKQHAWAHYDEQAAKITQDVAAQLAARATFYDQCLYGIDTLFAPTASKQMFALGAPWQYKNLNAGVSAWTELKHDTILYTEQAGAEMGGGEEFQIPPYIPPGPKGYVEPNPAFFHQLAAAIDQTLASLKALNFIPDEYADKLTTFRELAHRAERIAQKEVAGDAISRDDYEWIRTLRWSFNRELLLPRGADVIKDPSQLQMALVADVATDAVSGLVLEEGVGTPQRIVVVVKDAYGGTRLTVGYVYSWYEFSSLRRWSDAEWKTIIYTADAKPREQQGVIPPAWYAKFRKNAAGAP
jgi:hypothetical protein